VALDAAGISLMEIGPVAMDDLAAHAGSSGWEGCRITGATELCLVPATLVGAMAYGLCSIGVVVGDGGFAWYLAEPCCQGALYRGEEQESLAALVGGDNKVLELIEAAKLSPGSVLLMVGRGASEPRPSGHAAVRPQEKIATAHEKGIPVSQQTLDAFYALEVLTWAPTSERSRAQAGFAAAPAPSP
jgi:hypothetical protein